MAESLERTPARTESFIGPVSVSEKVFSSAPSVDALLRLGTIVSFLSLLRGSNGGRVTGACHVLSPAPPQAGLSAHISPAHLLRLPLHRRLSPAHVGPCAPCNVGQEIHGQTRPPSSLFPIGLSLCIPSDVPDSSLPFSLLNIAMLTSLITRTRAPTLIPASESMSPVLACAQVCTWGKLPQMPDPAHNWRMSFGKTSTCAR